MLTKTSTSAIRALIYLAERGSGQTVSPRRVAQEVGESPTYLAKIARLLVKAGIVRAEKGVKGGMRLGRSPDQITLLSIVEACQGRLLGAYCEDRCALSAACAYHQAAAQLYQANLDVLSRWNLAQLAEKPRPSAKLPRGVICLMSGSAGPSGSAGSRHWQTVAGRR